MVNVDQQYFDAGWKVLNRFCWAALVKLRDSSYHLSSSSLKRTCTSSPLVNGASVHIVPTEKGNS